MAAEYDGKVVFRVEDFGASPVADKLGVDKYPAIFIDDVLVATPDDFYDWEGQTPGRYTPWREQAGRDRFVADLRRMVELRLDNGTLEGKAFTAADPAAEVRLPDLTLQDLAGNAFQTAELGGQVVVVEFWASWCPPCEGTIQWLPQLGRKHVGDVTVLALAVQSEEQQVRNMVANVGEGMRVAMASLETTEAFGGVMAVPTLIVFDRQGQASAVFYGAPPDLHERVDAAVAELLEPAGSASVQQEVEFSGLRWTLNGDVVLEEVDGRPALRMRNGSAQIVDFEFENGTIEYDMRTTGQRSFAGVVFRAEGSDREHFYLRPHNTGRFDAMQYTPVFNGNSAWQLYPEFNASLEIPTDRWIHVKLVVAGPKLEAYIDGEKTSTLSVPDMRLGQRSGGMALTAFFPAAQTESLYPNVMSNFSVQVDDRTHDYPTPAGPAPDSGLLPRWAISASFAEPERPDQLVDAGGWQLVDADARGRVNLSRWVAKPAGVQLATVLARVTLESDRARVVRLGYGFSDKATVFLNGKPIFRGDNSYRTRSLRYLGVMNVDHDVLYLSLQPGANELTFAVSESFGGWGVTARLIDRDGVTVRAALGDD